MTFHQMGDFLQSRSTTWGDHRIEIPASHNFLTHHLPVQLVSERTFTLYLRRTNHGTVYWGVVLARS